MKRFFIILVALTTSCLTAKPSNQQEEFESALKKGSQFFKEGKYKEALPYFEKFLHMCEKGFGENDNYTFAALTLLGSDYKQLGDYKKALQMHERAYNITKKTHIESAQVSQLLLMTAEDLRALDQMKRALEIDEEALNMFRKEPGGEMSRDTASALNALSIDYLNIDNNKAIECGKQAIQIYQKVLNENDPAIITSYSNLGMAYDQSSDYENALMCHQKALVIGEKCWGTDNPNLAKVISKMADCFENLGDYKKATSAWERAIDISERSLGKEHADTAINICGMANYFSHIGDYSRALPLFKRALSITENTLGKDSLQGAYILESMSSCYGHTDPSTAIDLQKRVIEIRQKGFGSDDPHTISAWAGLGAQYLNKGEPQEALSYLEKSYNGCLKIFGDDNPHTLDSLSVMGHVYLTTTNYAKAEPIFEKGLSYHLNHSGINSEPVSRATRNLAEVYALEKKTEKANELTKKWVDSIQNQLNLMLTLGESQRLAWAAKNLKFSLPVAALPTDQLHQLILRWKGIVLDSIVEDQKHNKLIGATENGKKTLSDIQLLKNQIAKLATSSSKDDDGKIESLRQQIDNLESSLAKNFDNRVRDGSRMTIDQLKNVLAPDESLINIVSYGELGSIATTPPCYGVSVVNHNGNPIWIPVEEGAEIKVAVESYRKAIANGDETSLKTQIQILSEKLWKPIAASLPPTTKKLFISADGQLNFLSFATLLDEKGKFLCEDYQIAYVGTGRDLMRPAKPVDMKTMVIYANPLFASDDASKVATLDTNATPALGMRALELAEFAKVQLPQLPGTEKESEIISQIAKDALWTNDMHLGPDASKKGLMAMKAPAVLHLATHGFFLGGDGGGGEGERGMNVVGAVDVSPKESAENKPQPLKGISPMRQSGLALTGGQSTLQAWGRGEFPDPSNDGILTAEEVAGLDLNGTWLVTLSACETGVGQVQSGEGVFGLRRAFMMAGAQNLLMTLWPVSDETTPKIMADFYKKALAIGDAAGSFSDVQRDWLVKLRNEKGLLAAVRDAGPFAMVVMANPTLGKTAPASQTVAPPSPVSTEATPAAQPSPSPTPAQAVKEMPTLKKAA
ncbi:MAG: tetratricopeptide repeat protein [Verrucomicrobia bacterium]|nr:tetratricopeptide repeat protein [Verrucomicrobiota bacterium]